MHTSVLSSEKTTEEIPTPVLLLGKGNTRIPVEVSDEFITNTEFKRFPDSPELLAKLINTHPCVIDVDSLDPADKRMVLKGIGDRTFWLHSRQARTMVQLDPLNGLLILNSETG